MFSASTTESTCPTSQSETPDVNELHCLFVCSTLSLKRERRERERWINTGGRRLDGCRMDERIFVFRLLKGLSLHSNYWRIKCSSRADLPHLDSLQPIKADSRDANFSLAFGLSDVCSAPFSARHRGTCSSLAWHWVKMPFVLWRIRRNAFEQMMWTASSQALDFQKFVSRLSYE